MSSQSTLLVLGVGLLGVGIGFANYRHASRLDGELSKLRTLVARRDTSRIDANDELRRLQQRVAYLERQPRGVATGGAAAGGAAAGAEAQAAPAGEAPPQGDGAAPAGQTPAEVRQARLERRQREAARLVTEYWKKWGQENGLNEDQQEKLAGILAEAARQREVVRAKRDEGSLDRESIKAENRRISEEIRSRARELLNDDQFRKFEEMKGATVGGTWRTARRALRKQQGTE